MEHVFGGIDGNRCSECGTSQYDATTEDITCVERAPIRYTSESPRARTKR